MKIRRIYLHIIFWAAYLLFETYIEFAWISSSYANILPFDRWNMALLSEFLQLPVKLIGSYGIVFLINRSGNSIISAAKAILLMTACILAQRIVIIKFLLPYIYQGPADSNLVLHPPRIINTFLDFIFIVGLVVALKQYRISLASKAKQKELTREKLEAELKFLRTQINPHFLFNTLNNIYALARKKSDDTANAVMKLSKLFRFMLYESKHDFISIKTEIQVLKDYIELERIRYNERLQITMKEEVDDYQQQIAPLILLPFVENTFKHGASEARFESYIHIHLVLQQGILTFIVENSKEQDTTTATKENIGLGNVRRQLELLYPDHEITITNKEDSFHVQLIINLQKYASLSMPDN